MAIITNCATFEELIIDLRGARYCLSYHSHIHKPRSYVLKHRTDLVHASIEPEPK